MPPLRTLFSLVLGGGGCLSSFLLFSPPVSLLNSCFLGLRPATSVRPAEKFLNSLSVSQLLPTAPCVCTLIVAAEADDSSSSTDRLILFGIEDGVRSPTY